jgi:hypothetical protein
MRENIDMDDVLENLEKDRRTGKLARVVSRSDMRYGVDPEDPERLVSIDKEGRKRQLPRKLDSE